MRNILALVGVVVALAVFAGFNSFFIVDQREQAMVVQLGSPVRVIKDPGLAMKVPFFQSVIFFNKRILDLDAEPSVVITKDVKNIVVDAFARFRISDPLKFYQSVRDEESARLRLMPILNSNLRRVLGEQNFNSLLSGERSQLMRAIRDAVAVEARAMGIEIVDVRIRRSDLPEANLSAVYERMKTERQQKASQTRAEGGEEAQRVRSLADKEVTVINAEATRKSDILRGEGEGERNRILGEAYGRDAEFFAFYRSLQAYEESMNGQNTTMVLSPNSPFFRYFQNGQSGRR
ncbi:MAG: protease modulator HflC [Alphaproteobacteria bacterium]|nr:protease modulator HflC [Alphaproteobacteria bacterium]